MGAALPSPCSWQCLFPAPFAASGLRSSSFLWLPLPVALLSWASSRGVEGGCGGAGEPSSLSPETAKAPGGLPHESESTSRRLRPQGQEQGHVDLGHSSRGARLSWLQAQAESNRSTFISVHCQVLCLGSSSLPPPSPRTDEEGWF